MDEKERRVVDDMLTALQQHQWATERCVESLANLIWNMRDYFPMERRQQMDYILSHVPRLQKVRLVDEREGVFLRADPGFFGPSRWMLMCEFPPVPFCPADPFKYAESLAKFCEILTGAPTAGGGPSDG